MKTPIVGGSYQMDALSFAVQRAINLYPLAAEVPNTKEPTALRGTPGLTEFLTAGAGGNRGSISVPSAGRAFSVVADELYEIFADGTSTLRGTLNSSVNIVGIANNGTQVMIVDGADGYIFTLATNAFVQISDPDFPGADTVVFQDTYFIIQDPDTGKFYISDNNDGLVWNALDFAVVESSPDNLVTILSNRGDLWLFGQETTEVYQNTGAAAFPFERISGAVIPVGCAATFTAAKFDNTVIWLGTDEYGRGTVWMADGYNARRVSTQPMESIINSVSDFTDSYSWVYHEQGHVFYCLQITGLDTTLVYDGATGLWHERQYNGVEQHRGATQFFFAQKNLIGDRLTGQIYEMALDIYEDDGVEIQRERIFPHIHNEKMALTFKRLELDMETGVGLVSGQGSDPQVMMQLSDNGGKTWSAERWVSFGKIGEYDTRVFWNQLGTARDRVYKIRISDPVFTQINGAYLNAT